MVRREEGVPAVDRGGGRLIPACGIPAAESQLRDPSCEVRDLTYEISDLTYEISACVIPAWMWPRIMSIATMLCPPSGMMMSALRFEGST